MFGEYRMKKWIVLAVMVAALAGCGSGGAKENSKSEKNSESVSTTEISTSKTETSSSEKKIEMKDVDFQVEGTNYKMKILDNWKVLEDDEFSFSAENDNNVEGVMVSGVKKTDVDDFVALKSAMKEQMKSDDEVRIKEETIKEEPYQTPHYTGELYSFIGVADGANTEIRFYFLETETEYIILNFVGLPSFFERNDELVTEMVRSFVAG
jgi:predicted small lipoprotein YifL